MTWTWTVAYDAPDKTCIKNDKNRFVLWRWTKMSRWLLFLTWTLSECVRFYGLCSSVCECLTFHWKTLLPLIRELRKTWQCEKYSCRCHKETLIIIITMAMLFTDFLSFSSCLFASLWVLESRYWVDIVPTRQVYTLFVWFETRVLNNFHVHFTYMSSHSVVFSSFVNLSSEIFLIDFYIYEHLHLLCLAYVESNIQA